MSLRSAKTDKRYLDDTEKQALEVGGSDRRQERDARRVKARRGALAYQRNRQERTTSQRPGSGGQGAKYAQAARASEARKEKERSESFRPTSPKTVNYRPEDPA